jgi:3-hydroxyisobutyrate dehydrogenase
MSRHSVGFAGLGAMGSALAGRLVGASELTVFDLDPTRARALVAAGARATDNACGLADADIIITCLPTSDHVRALLDELPIRAGTLVVDCTSGDPVQTRAMAAELAGRGSTLIDAPVSGGPQAAAAGTIAILVGADLADFRRAEPVLRLISPAIRLVGSVGAGHCVKALNNALAAGQRLLAFEALAIAITQGVDGGSFIDAVNISSGRSYATESTVPRHILSGRLDQGFSLGLMAKDTQIALGLAPPGLAPDSLVAQIAARIASAADTLGTGADVNRVIEILEHVTGAVLASSDRGPAAQ